MMELIKLPNGAKIYVSDCSNEDEWQALTQEERDFFLDELEYAILKGGEGDE